MKSNKNVKILLPLVIVIWGIVIYKIVDAFSPDEISITQNVNATYKAPEIQSKEAFDLLPVTSDPFLGTLYKKPKTGLRGNSRSKKGDDVAWPSISYLGIVSDKNTKASVYIVQIKGQQYLLKPGEVAQGVELINGSKEMVRLRFEKATKEFPIM